MREIMVHSVMLGYRPRNLWHHNHLLRSNYNDEAGSVVSVILDYLLLLVNHLIIIKTAAEVYGDIYSYYINLSLQ